MDVNKVAKICIWVYPVFLIASLLWFFSVYRRSDALRAELERAKQEIEREIGEAAQKWGSEEDIEGLEELLGRWRRLAGLRTADVPVLLGEVARLAGCELEGYVSRGSLVRDGYEWESGEVSIKGDFSAILSFLAALERYPESFIAIPSLALRPGWDEAGLHEARVFVRVLLERAEGEELESQSGIDN